MKKDIKFQTQRISFPNGTVASTYTTQVETRSDYDLVTGLELYENANTGNANYRIGLRDTEDRLVLDNVNKDKLLVAPSVPKSDTQTAIYTEARKKTLFIKVEILATLTAPLDIDLVLVHTQNETVG